jgi:hypothetical protein
MVQEHLIDRRLRAFDHNGDGFFSGEEVTPEQVAALERVTNDTGRTFAPITGALFALAYSGLFFGALSAARSLSRYARRLR